MVDDLKYWVALNIVLKGGKKTFAILVERFGSPEKVFEASRGEL